MSVTQFSALAALLIGGFLGIAFVLAIRSIDKRIDQLDKRIDGIAAQVIDITRVVIAMRKE